MKKTLLLITIFGLLQSLLVANNLPIPTKLGLVDTPGGISISSNRVAPEYTFTKLPTAIVSNYYDYMIGGYNGMPLRVIPNAGGGGYFMSFHGRRDLASIRRVFYAYIDANGDMENNEINGVGNQEGYCTTAVDPVSGKPFYAWHCDTDEDTDYFEVEAVFDRFTGGTPGLFNNTQIAIDNPFTIYSPGGDPIEGNEFVWPTAQIGPSPIAGKRRVYVAGKNSITSSYGPSENMLLAYADFDGNDIETGVPLVWNYVTIPELNQWNLDDQWRRPFYAITTDNAGNVYYAGYHSATESDGSTKINEPDIDVFVCPNYGQGTWTRYSAYSNLNMWNPNSSPSDTTGYFTNPDLGNIPYGNNGELRFAMLNSSHLNASVDNLGRIHVLGVWALCDYSYTPNHGNYYPAMQFVKEFVFDPATQEFEIHEVYPQKDPADNYNTAFCPWDREAPFGEVDEYQLGNLGGFHPVMATDWPFPHWDASAHANSMIFQYNLVRITNANSQGMMAAVWQNSQRARRYNYYYDNEYAAYANTPEIHISVSPDNGNTWSEPIVINNVETQQFAGIKPMWVYPADQVIYTGMQGNSKVGKLGIMFYNDFTWGSNVILPSCHPNPDGGEVMFMELEIVFPSSIPPAQMEEFFVQSVSDDAIQLVWSASYDTDFAGYRVYHDTNPEVGTDDDLWDWHDDPNLQNVGSGMVSTTVTGLEATTRYYFLLQAVDQQGNITQHPNVITGMTSSSAPPLAPQNLSIAIEGSLLTLDWDDVTLDQLGNPITVSCYEVHASGHPYFGCSNETLLDTVLTSELLLDGVSEYGDRLFFKVIAVTGAIRGRAQKGR